MGKVRYITKEMVYMARKHRLLFLLPLFLALALIAVLAFQIGPAVVISFIYAGV